MPPITKHTNSLTARQRARQATQEHHEKLKQRQSVLTDVFSALDARDAADIAAGKAIIKLKDISGTNAEIASELGLTTLAVSRLIKTAEESELVDVGSDSNSPEDSAPDSATVSDDDSDTSNSGERADDVSDPDNQSGQVASHVSPLPD